MGAIAAASVGELACPGASEQGRPLGAQRQLEERDAGEFQWSWPKPSPAASRASQLSALALAALQPCDLQWGIAITVHLPTALAHSYGYRTGWQVLVGTYATATSTRHAQGWRHQEEGECFQQTLYTI